MSKKTLVLLGDSLTYGYGIHKKESWAYKLNSIENLNVINRGVNGSTTTDMLNRFTKDVINLNPDIIFIMGGTNDVLSNRDLSLILNNIKLMIKEGSTITKNIIIGIPPTIYKSNNSHFIDLETFDYIFKNLKKLRLALINLCKELDIKYIDFFTETNLPEYYDYIFIDGVHLNALGNDLIYQKILSALI
ncbi:SGNH/GDSL hydrolase family protein [Caproiciproducens sp. MSJ-32]|uniref:SGNH/GDSL hydrolase family protein n=1 Tax=Caproiciproducens sp. MSJ-32 TaxID=2841527 RepID=UPI001C104E3A|nr:GDSL-type esterase/lipase family protein [Caproiciproducens sp. MSJ-32]MBU5455044.1 GDSL family lipase [Caproiciproducens sp. MSJ-32]